MLIRFREAERNLMYTSRTTSRLRACAALVICAACFLGATVAQASDWTSFRGNSSNNAVTLARTPRATSESSLKWALTLKQASDWATSVGDPIIIGTHLYIPVGSNLNVVNKDTGVVEATTALPGPIDYSSRPVYGNGQVFVPLSEGRVCAISTSTNKALWTTPSIETTDASNTTQTHQSLSTPLYADGKLYIGTTVADWTKSYRGEFVCIDVAKDTTDAASRVVWTYDNTSSGYYWSGAAKIGKAIVVAGDDGVVTSFDSATGAVLDEKPMGKNIKVRSTVVAYNGQAVFTTKDGRLYRVTINSDGTFGKGAWSARFAQDSTTTPAIYNNLAFVGGQNLNTTSANKGVYCAINLSTMDVVRRVETPNISQSSALLSYAVPGNPIAYFSMNNYPGGIYGISLKSGSTPLNFFQPTGDQANYCASSLIADSAGTIYYTNDSGKLFAVKTTIGKSNDARIKSMGKTKGAWSTKWSSGRLNPKYIRLTLSSSTSSVKLSATRSNSHAKVYMRTSGKSWKQTSALNVKLSKGKKTSAYIKCVAENGKTTNVYRIIVNRKK